MAAVAAVILIVAGAVLVAVMVAARPAPAFSSTVLPPAVTAASGSQTGAADSSRSAAAPAAAPQAGAANSFAGSGLVPNVGPCGAAPTVQFQGRGLAATGVASVAVTGQAPTTLNVNITTRAADASGATAAALTALGAAESALVSAGVPATVIRRSNFSLNTDFQSRQLVAYASLQAEVTAEQSSRATAAVAQVSGVSGYNLYQGSPPESTADQVRAAMAEAAARARELAAAAAQASGVTLGQVEGVVAQPPAVCGYGPGGPQRSVQVTVTYALR